MPRVLEKIREFGFVLPKSFPDVRIPTRTALGWIAIFLRHSPTWFCALERVPALFFGLGCQPVGIASTGHGARLKTCSVVLPRRASSNPSRPRLALRSCRHGVPGQC